MTASDKTVAATTNRREYIGKLVAMATKDEGGRGKGREPFVAEFSDRT
jgi:hypothetical protein